ncbi:hypothetical protein [Mixta calida]|uniref:hypothetical protein n=1 Tax=Mixta calida TaxID=665913 RepID=UPI0029062EF6|nr:hypothetical protein [Mixta calida]MDU4291110.1 hypothetical protein [Mixta calida]
MKKFITWLKAIFTRTKEINVSEITIAPAFLGGASAGAEADSAAPIVDAGAVANTAAPVVTVPATSGAVSSVAETVSAVATVAASAADVAHDAVTLAAAVDERLSAVLSALKGVLTFAEVEVEHIWDEAVAISKKLA